MIVAVGDVAFQALTAPPSILVEHRREHGHGLGVPINLGRAASGWLTSRGGIS